MHHGPVTINKQFIHILDEIIAWQNKQEDRKSWKNFVLLGIAEAEKMSVLDDVRAILAKRGIYFVEKCDELRRMTLGDAIKRSRNILALNQCW